MSRQLLVCDALVWKSASAVQPNRPTFKEGEKMKTSSIGLFLAASLMVVAGVGFGIAHAGGDQLDNRAWTLEKWITEYPNDEVAPAMKNVLISLVVPEESWMKGYGND